jgi:hypothetical protein
LGGKLSRTAAGECCHLIQAWQREYSLYTSLCENPFLSFQSNATSPPGILLHGGGARHMAHGPSN